MALQRDVERLARSRRHPGVVLATGGLTGPVELASAGNLTGETPFYAASATKLLITALMVMSDAPPLDTPFREILTGPDTEGLHRKNGRDRTGEITLRHLLQHTSGLPDYFEAASSKSGLLAELLTGADRAWTFAEAMEIARRLGPIGAPGDLRRAHYSDTNFQLLGKVIEQVHGKPLAEVLNARLFAPLGLSQTWLASDPADLRPVALRYKEQALPIPRAMASFQADGGLVTTALEGLQILRAIFGGVLFDASRLSSMYDWRPWQFPLSYGTGMMRFTLPRLMTGFRDMPELIGHSGLSGAVLFHAPRTGLCIAGTVNQIDRPGTVFRLMASAALSG